jgi:lipopolysaccharide transport system permease protein
VADRHPLAMIVVWWQYRNLIWLMARRELQAGYKGSIFGFGWTVLQPLLMLCVYTFVFSVIFKGRWGIASDGSQTSFALVLFLGLITFRLFSEMIGSASQLVSHNSVYVKKVQFPLEILPIVRLLNILVDTFISLAVLMVGVILFGQKIHMTALLLPVVWIPMLLLSLGAGYALAALGVFIRDIHKIAGILTTLLFFASAIFYPIESVPEPYRILFRINPLALFVEFSRKLVFWGDMPDWTLYGIWLILAAGLFTAGTFLFVRSKRAFADVL